MVTAHPFITGSETAAGMSGASGGGMTAVLLWTFAGPVIVYLGLVSLIGLIAWRTHVRGDVETNLRVLEILVRVLPWRGGREQVKASARGRKSRSRKGSN